MMPSFVKSCLIVSPHFPPSTLAGVHRARHLLKHLPSHGWRARVICVDPQFHIEQLDPELARLVPEHAAVIRVGALPIELTRLFGIAGEIGLRGLGHIRAAIANEMRTDKPDVVLITGSPYYPMLLTKWIAQRWATPVVLDFQDPWVSREGASRRFATKAWLSHRLATALEPTVVRHAAFITGVSDQQNEEMIERHPWLDRSRMAGIAIGGDPDDFSAFAATPQTPLSPHLLSPHLRRNRINVLYAGTIWGAALPTLTTFLEGIRILRQVDPNLFQRLHIAFLGTTATPRPSNDYRVIAKAQEFGIASALYEVPERRPFLEAIKAMTQSSINVILGSDEPHYTASKVFPVLMAGRPYLSLLHRKSSGQAILEAASGGLALSFETRAELAALSQDVAHAVATLATRPETVGRIDPSAYGPYTAHAVAGRFAAIFDLLSERAATSGNTIAA